MRLAAWCLLNPSPMRLAHLSLLLLAACGGGGGLDEAALDGGGDPTGQPDAGGGGGGGGDACGPATCDGCCDGETCLAGDSDDECGGGGAACQSCGRWGECSEAAICELAADTRWDVVMVSASVSAVNQGGTNWDGGTDRPDVYVRAFATEPGSGTHLDDRTDDHETLTPTWNETLFANLAGGALEGMQIELFDDDDNDDDTMGDCVAGIRLEDAEAGELELDCPRGLFAGRDRAGWTLRIRLEPRSQGRPDAPAFDRHAAAPRETEPGTCAITWDGDAISRSVMFYDSWGRVLRQEWVDDQGDVSVSQSWECSGTDHCEDSSSLFNFHRLEPGPFGLRVRVDSNDVFLYDSLGRLVARHDHSGTGSLFGRTIYRHSAKTRVEHHQDLDESPVDLLGETAEFDEHGSPLFFVGATYTKQVLLNQDGLPARIEVVKSTNPDLPVGSGSDYTYEGAGCAEVLAVGMTNGLVSR